MSMAERTVTRESKRARFTDIDRCKGLAILLVVLGHITLSQPLEGNEWYYFLRGGIYRFHMPFFMFLSGFVFFYAGYGMQSLSGYWKFVRSRFIRLVIPFISCATLIIVGKFATRQFIHVDNLNNNPLDSVVAVFWNTGQSPAGSVWYIFVLFIYCLVVPPILAVLRGSVTMLFVLSIFVYFAPRVPYFYLDLIVTYFIFFMFGAILAGHYEYYVRILDKYYTLFIAIFIVSIGILPYLGIGWLWSLLAGGLTSVPAIHALVRTRLFNQSSFWLWLGKYSFIIYLLNTMLIGFTKGIMLKIAPWDGSNFFVFAPILFSVGLLAPIAFKKFVLVHFTVVDKITD